MHYSAEKVFVQYLWTKNVQKKLQNCTIPMNKHNLALRTNHTIYNCTMELVFSTNFVGVFAPLTDFHNYISELGAKTVQTVCANKRRYQQPPLYS